MIGEVVLTEFRRRHRALIVGKYTRCMRFPRAQTTTTMTMISRHFAGVILAALVAVSPRASSGQATGRAASKGQEAQSAAQRRALLLDPTRPFWSTRAPATFTADIETSRGTIAIELTRA